MPVWHFHAHQFWSIFFAIHTNHLSIQGILETVRSCWRYRLTLGPYTYAAIATVLSE
jgi:hypothetical protein